MSKLLNVALAVLVIGLAISWWYRLPKYSNEEMAPDFTASLIDGNTFSLSDLRGSYVLIDFWGSWCGPCRRENPKLVQLYNDHYGNDFKIVSIAIEQNADRMRAAIKQDKLIWPHHIPQMDRFKSPIASMYGVKEIPTKYLVDPNGKIIGVNMSVSDIHDLLTTVL